MDPFTSETIFVSPMACTRLGIVWLGSWGRGGVLPPLQGYGPWLGMILKQYGSDSAPTSLP